MVQNKLFVQVNDSIRKLASDEAESQGEAWGFICECPEVSCHAMVNLTLSEFDERRASSPPIPVHAAEHDFPPELSLASRRDPDQTEAALSSGSSIGATLT